MHHVDEHIVELYYLGGLKDEKLRKEVEVHLAECYSCNELYTKIRDFYQEVDNINSLNPKETKLLGSNALITRPNFTAAFHFLPNSLKNFLNSSLIFVITRPVQTGLSFVGMITFVFLALNFNSLFKDTNPDFFKVDKNIEKIDLFSKKGEFLYSLKYDLPYEHNIDSIECTFNVNLSALIDLNNDNKNDFVTVIHEISNGLTGTDKVNAFNHKGEFIFGNKLGKSVTYNGVLFDDQLESKALIINDFDKDGLQEIYVLSSHRNSPTVVTKLDSKGNWIGEYWHYGWFWGFNKVKLGDKEGILLCGINDKDSANRNPVISFIDPTKIIGYMQSANTIGFENFEVLKEINYKYFPIITPKFEGLYKPRITSLLNTDNTTFIKVLYFLNSYDGLGDITLDKNFNITDVKVVDAFKLKFGELPKADLELLLKK